LELRQIRYFIAVAEERSFSEAARRMFVSQPPITRQVRQLEDELGVQLFERRRKGVELTAAGAVFLEEARRVLIHTRLAEERSQAAGKGQIGKLEIGYFGSPIYSVIPAIIRRYCADNPRASVSLQPINKRDQPDALRDRRIHVGFARYYPHASDIKIETVVRESIVLATSNSHFAAADAAISPKQLKGEPMIVFPETGRPSFADEVIRLLREQGVEPEVVYEAADLSSAMAMTAAGQGVCPVPESVTKLAWPNLCHLRIRGVSAKSPVSCVYLDSDDSPLLKSFIRAVKAEYRSR